MDCLSPRVVALALWVMIASVLDAFITTAHLADGFSEGNPVMALALAYDIKVFATVKMAVSASGCWMLAALQQYPLAHGGLYGLALIYLGVLATHGMVMLAS